MVGSLLKVESKKTLERGTSQYRCFDGNVAVSEKIGIDRKVCFIGILDKNSLNCQASYEYCLDQLPEFCNNATRTYHCI